MQDPFFRGCTRPAMLVGVPLVAMVPITCAFMLLGVWSAFLISGYVLLLLALLYLRLIVALRAITRKDDQRLRQLWLRARMRALHGANRLRWGAYSYGPLAQGPGG
nr:VirB3 family type IV secretion system protein [Duganella sp. SG902]